jgi:endo-1,4-beta-xylanase
MAKTVRRAAPVLLGFCVALTAWAADAQTTLRSATAQRAIPIGSAADANEYGQPDKLANPQYAGALSAQYSMLEPENAMKWDVTQPTQTTFIYGPGDELVKFAQTNNMKVRGHNLCWHTQLPSWLAAYAKTATPQQMSDLIQAHINAVVGHYKGQVFAWDVVNEPFNDPATGVAPDLRNSIWYNQPGIGLAGTGYIEKALQWAHAADPDALLFINDYNLEQPGAKFNALYAMAKDFVARGVPLHGVGFEMHIDATGYPSSSGLAQNIQALNALGLQVHITEMDVRLPVDSNGNATAANLQAQAATYQRILTVCLQNPGCTAFQMWGLSDGNSWIPGSFPGYGAALPFDVNYQPKPAVASMLNAMATVPPNLNAANVVNAAGYQGGAVAPGELVTVYGANYGPAALVPVALDNGGRVASTLAGSQVTFDGIAAPLIYSLAGAVSAVVPYEVAGKNQTVIQYSYNGVSSNTAAIPVVQAVPAIFSLNSTGTGPGVILNPDNSVNSPANPVARGSYVTVFGTGAGILVDGAVDGAPATGAVNQMLTVTATIGGVNAPVLYAGSAPGDVNGVLQVDLTVPTGITGVQSLVITVGGASSQPGITVAVK